MAKDSKGQTKSKHGRPSLYKEAYNHIAYRHCLLGATDAELAELFGVTETTINNWKVEHSSFFESIKEGKAEADAKVALALHDKATGYYKDVLQIKVDKDGQEHEVTKRLYFPPETTAQIFWLKNRKPEIWRDKQDIEHSGRVEMPAIMIGKTDD